jgi:hypothetical protein
MREVRVVVFCGNNGIVERLFGSGKTLLVGFAPACPNIFVLVFACCEVGAAIFFKHLHMSSVR